MKIFKIVTFVAMVWSLAVVALGILGVALTGFYPAVAVLLSVALIPIASKYYAGKITGKSEGFQRRYRVTLTVANLLIILVVSWMAFVITIDRIIPNLIN